MAEPSNAAQPAPLPAVSPARAGLAVLLAWLVPGAGHALLGRRWRALIFLVLVLLAVLLGAQLGGNLPRSLSGAPLEILATLACMGSGLPYFVLRLTGYAGTIEGAGYEYGSAFLLTAGLMNLLLLLDVWDIARGRKP